MRNRSEFEEALNWYDLAIARQDPDERSDNFAAVNRRMVRRKLGLPPDDLDASVEHLERHLDDIVRQVRAKPAAPPDPPR